MWAKLFAHKSLAYNNNLHEINNDHGMTPKVRLNINESESFSF